MTIVVCQDQHGNQYHSAPLTDSELHKLWPPERRYRAGVVYLLRVKRVRT